MSRVSFNGSVVDVTSYGKNDGKLPIIIQGGFAPYKMDLFLASDKINPIRTYENIPASNPVGAVNLLIEDLAPDAYHMHAYDAGDPLANPPIEPTWSESGFEWPITSPPYALLKGTVNPLGVSTEVSFEYGLTTEYGFTATHGLVNGNVPVEIEKRLSAGGQFGLAILVPNQEYHYRLKGTNINGVFYSNDMMFVTPPAAPILIALPAIIS